jgi:hypothetical protein
MDAASQPAVPVSQPAVPVSRPAAPVSASFSSAEPLAGTQRTEARIASPTASPASPETQTAETCTSVFGLDIVSTTAPSLIAGATVTAAPSGRALALSVVDGDPAQLGWPQQTELVCDEREPDGAVKFRIEADPEHGYLIAGPRYGAHLLSTDGARLRCYPPGRADTAWQRLLIAQVLPFAALLQGLEVLHASAVVKDGAALAFLGSSGAGKTSIALELCYRGAGFLADDVLALEVRGGELTAHPGTPFAGIGTAAAETIRTKQRLLPEHVVALDDPAERLVWMGSPAAPTPLGALFLLERRGVQTPEPPRFEPAADARLLLSSTFNFVLAAPARLRRLLDVCALAAQLRVERIVCDQTTSVAQLATAIEEQLATAQ